MKKKIIFGLLSFISFISLWVCSSNNQQSIEKSTLNVPRNIPNSTAHVSCRFLELREENDIIYGIIEIDTVLGYGASTPPLSPAVRSRASPCIPCPIDSASSPIAEKSGPKCFATYVLRFSLASRAIPSAYLSR